MAISLGFGQGNKNTPMSGSTGGGSIQPKLQLNGQGQLVTDGSGGFLNYLTGLAKNAVSGAVAPASQPPLQPPAPAGGAGGQAAANTSGQDQGSKSGSTAMAALGGGL